MHRAVELLCGVSVWSVDRGSPSDPISITDAGADPVTNAADHITNEAQDAGISI